MSPEEVKKSWKTEIAQLVGSWVPFQKDYELRWVKMYRYNKGNICIEFMENSTSFLDLKLPINSINYKTFVTATL